MRGDGVQSGLTSLLEDGVARGVYTGAQAAVSVEGRPTLQLEIGRRGAGLEAVGPDVRFDLASLTKALGTAVLWAHHFEAGRVDPSDRLADLWPGADRRIEHHHLLRHASGLPAHQRFDLRLPPTLRVGSPEARSWIVRAAATTPTDAAPGEQTRYSDVGFIALGGILAATGAAPLEDQLTRLGCPLRGPRPPEPSHPHPTRALTAAPDALWDRRATSGRRPVGAVHDENAFAMGGIAGHAGQFGSATEVVRWAEALLAAWHGDRQQPLAPETVRQMWRPRPGSAWVWGWDRPTPGGTTGDAWPEDAVGHLGFTGTSLWIHPGSGLIAVLLTNRTAAHGDPGELRDIRRTFHRAVWARWGAVGRGGVRSAPGDPS